MDTSIINKAIIYATEKHSGAYRKGTNIPYIMHPLEAGAIAASITDSTETVAGAILHDTVEDTFATREEIAGLFGERIAELVAGESENKRENLPAGDTWLIRKQKTLDSLKACDDRDVLIIALADKLSNLRSIQRDFEKTGDDFWNRFNQKNPKMHKWYYESFIEICKCLDTTDAYREYVQRIEAVFGSIK